MTTASSEGGLGPLSPLLVSRDVEKAAAFYVEHLGFELRLRLPEKDPFFMIVGRDQVQILLKAVAEDVVPTPNPTRHEWLLWDAYVHTNDPDALAAEFKSRGVEFRAGVIDRDDGLQGFEIEDADGYVLFFGRPVT